MARTRDLARLVARLEAIPKEVREAVKPALELSGKELADRMKALAPEDDGDLKRSITITPPGGMTPPYSTGGGQRVAGPLEVIVTAGNSDVRYAHLQEFGTKQHPAHPYFWPAFRSLKKRIEGRLKRSIAKAVRDGWAK